MSYDNATIRNMSDVELVHAELQLDRDLVALRFQKKAGTVKNTQLMKGLRKSIARLQTEQSAREIKENLFPGTLRELHRDTFEAKAVAKKEGSSFASELNEQIGDAE